MSLRITSVSAFVAVLAASGCGGSGSGDTPGTAGQSQTGNCALDFANKTATPFTVGMTSTISGTTVALESTPPVPVVSDHSTWMMTVTDSMGAPVPAGTKVSVKCLMTHSNIPSHGCPANIGVKEMGNGVYEAKPVIFNMPGHWTVSVTVDSTAVPFELCVE